MDIDTQNEILRLTQESYKECSKRNRELVLLNVRLRDVLKMAKPFFDVTPSLNYSMRGVIEKALYGVTPGGTACKRGHTAGANDPQECAWPHCDCDPVTNSVMGALMEEGILLDDGKVKKALDDVIAVVQSYVASKQSSP